MDNINARRVAALRRIMLDRGWDAIVLSGGDPHCSEYPAPRWQQIKWLSSFTGEAADMAITLSHAGLWTDTRYFIQAERQLSGTDIALHKTRIPEQVLIPEWLHSQFPDGEITVAVDGMTQSLSSVRDILSELGPSCRIDNVPDLMSVLWEDRPGIPATPIITIGEDLSGESREHKINRCRKWMLRSGADAMLLTALDDIAWLLNVRASDILYNPLVISYLLITQEDVDWYVKKDTFSEEDPDTLDSFLELREDGVRTMDYDDVFFGVASLGPERGVRSIAADPSTLNYNLGKALEESGLEVIEKASPVALWKAVKNAAEIEGMRDAHVEDGAAMERFLYSLEMSLSVGEEIDEKKAADRLDAFRSRIPGYRGNSFETISAYGPSAALPHYVTPPYDSPLLSERGLYLTDSGGQYIFGTTDITRTIPLGPCTRLEKEDYTLVLKGHIDLCMAVFPEGTAGCQIDVLARGPLWRSKRNFGHGTGHGVGSFLCVHEGPQDIRQNFNRTPLLPGMVVSDEPGIYREGLHGVRHENLLLVVDAGTNEFGKWLTFEPLTLCHFDREAILPELLTADEIRWIDAYHDRVCRTLSPLLPPAVAAWLRHKTRPL